MDACQALVGRTLTIPQAVFQKDIDCNRSKEPPSGGAWRAVIADYKGKGRTPFVIVLQVLDPDGEIEDEEQDASLAQIRKWLDAADDEDRLQIGVQKPKAQTAALAIANTTAAADLFVALQTPTAT